MKITSDAEQKKRCGPLRGCLVANMLDERHTRNGGYDDQDGGSLAQSSFHGNRSSASHCAIRIQGPCTLLG